MDRLQSDARPSADIPRWSVGRAVGLEPNHTAPPQNGCESFNVKLRDELLDGEVFYSCKEAQTVIEPLRRHYNTVRPHSALDYHYRPPAPETAVAAVASLVTTLFSLPDIYYRLSLAGKE